MPVSPFDIARTHVRLPVSRDCGALKTALRDWLRYTEETPLRDKAAFPAVLCIEVRRPSPSALRQSGAASAASSMFARPFAGKLNAWRRRYGAAPEQRKHEPFPISSSSSSASASPTPSAAWDAAAQLSHVHKHHVPLTLYTALLPWEVQRGLSQSTLTLPTAAAQQATPPTEASTAAVADRSVRGDAGDSNSGKEEMPFVGQREEERRGRAEAEADPFGVVTSATATTTMGAEVAPHGPVGTTTRPSVSTSSFSSPSDAIPGMLFVLDLAGVQENGGQIGFWSGAITQPIDVLFFAPTEAATVAQSASFQRIRQRDVQMQVEDSAIAPGVVTRFFPKNELKSPDRYALKLHTYSHLDPFPGCEAGEGEQHERRFSVEAPVTREDWKDPATLPRLVLETIRHTVRQQVERALAESLADYRRVYGDEGVAVLEHPQERADVQLDLDISLQLSDALRADVMNKAQLHVHYVAMLEDAVQQYAAALNRPTHSDASADPLVDRDDDGGSHVDGTDGQAEGSNAAGRRMQVWLSPTEQVWMTPDELAALQRAQGKKHRQTPWEASLDAEREDDDAAFMAAAHATDAEFDGSDDGDREREGKKSAISVADERHPAGSAASLRTAASASRGGHPFVIPAQEGGVRADRRIARQSPMLAEEDEGRPSSLGPSFTGRHEAGTLSQLATTSADKLARYPRTRSEMPVLPPIDYELLDLCTRLGVGQRSVLYHYYERILREWRHELKVLRQPLSTAQTDQPRSGSIGAEDVQRMSALVHDPSLQVPEELRALVDAVVAAREKRQQEQQLHGR